MENVAKRIKKAMDAANINQTELAEKTGISKGAISSYLSGRYKPKTETIVKIARVLNVSESWLMGYSENNSAQFETNLQKEIAKADTWQAKEKQELLELLANLDDSDMEKIVDYLKLLIAAKGK